MWSGGSGGRPPYPPKGARRYTGAYNMGRYGQPRPQVRTAQQAAVVRKPRPSLWRKVRQQVRALWRWMVVRTVRGWATRLGKRPPTGQNGGQSCDVRQFPTSKWQ